MSSAQTGNSNMNNLIFTLHEHNNLMTMIFFQVLITSTEEIIFFTRQLVLSKTYWMDFNGSLWDDGEWANEEPITFLGPTNF